MRTTLKSLLVAAMTLAVTPAFADPVEDGEKVYKTKTCMACHGIKGARPVLSYPMLAGQNEKYLLTQLKDIKAGKRVGSTDVATGHPYIQGMVDIMHLVEEKDLENVAKYLSSLPAGKPKAIDPPPAPELLTLGEERFNKLGCKACHGKDGMKPTAKNYPFISGLNAEYLARAMTEIRDKVRVNGQSKLMFGTIKKASDEDIAAMSAWLSTLDRTAQ